MSKKNFFKLGEAHFLGSFTSVQAMPTSNKAEFCFLGRSNSGKSSLLQALIQNPSIVKTSRKAGHTQTINLFDIKFCYLADLPGYGYAQVSHKKRERMSQILADYLQKRKNVQAAFIVHDIRRDITQEEQKLAYFLREHNIAPLLILSKSDKLNQKQMAKTLKKISLEEKNFHTIYIVSSVKQKGLQPLVAFIRSMSG